MPGLMPVGDIIPQVPGGDKDSRSISVEIVPETDSTTDAIGQVTWQQLEESALESRRMIAEVGEAVERLTELVGWLVVNYPAPAAEENRPDSP